MHLPLWSGSVWSGPGPDGDGWPHPSQTGESYGDGPRHPVSPGRKTVAETQKRPCRARAPVEPGALVHGMPARGGHPKRGPAHPCRFSTPKGHPDFRLAPPQARRPQHATSVSRGHSTLDMRFLDASAFPSLAVRRRRPRPFACPHRSKRETSESRLEPRQAWVGVHDMPDRPSRTRSKPGPVQTRRPLRSRLPFPPRSRSPVSR